MTKSIPLFYAFDVPEGFDAPPTEKYESGITPEFDFERGDFVCSGARKMVPIDGREAYVQWCQKIVRTERMAHLAYGDEIGVEMHAAMALDDPWAVKSAIERTVTEALMVNKRTEYVRAFEFTMDGDELHVSFIVKGRDFEEERLNVRMDT